MDFWFNTIMIFLSVQFFGWLFIVWAVGHNIITLSKEDRKKLENFANFYMGV